MTGMEEESRERMYSVRYEGKENYGHEWGFFTTAEEARQWSKALTSKYGEGFFPVFVDTVTSSGRI